MIRRSHRLDPADDFDMVTVPGHVLTGRLSSGPLCDVYAAACERTGAPRAVKVLRAEHEPDPDAVKLTHREARAGLAVRHPRLVRVLEASVLRPPHYVVMDWLPGESLHGRLRRDGALPPGVAVSVTRQIAEALAALHAAGFTHGDIKPDNVMLTDAGASLTDLGFAHRPGEILPLLDSGCVMGTPHYLAPELCRRPAEDTSAADIFSLGVSLFEMLTGELPYPPGTVAETLCRHAHDEPASLDGPLGGLVGRMLSPDPRRRPSAGRLVGELIAAAFGSEESKKNAFDISG